MLNQRCLCRGFRFRFRLRLVLSSLFLRVAIMNGNMKLFANER